MKSKFALVEIAKLRIHEEIEEDRVRALAEAIARDGLVERAIIADRATLVVIDGHHRHAALTRLGCLRAPVVLVDYMDPAIVVENWRAGEPAPTKEEVLERAARGKPFPPKTTRHPGLYDLTEVRVPLADLR
ncbi:MAG TPA: ParB N-terminal domain-containing protein [Candidatus Thermoplasmatota archaeon]|nr:ParB N-terminal domain-containing protein [Candidatus Thermoplasmatota archaeon]